MIQITDRRETTPALQEFVDTVLPKHRKYFLKENEHANELDFLESLHEIYSIDLSDYIRFRGKDFFDDEIHKNKRIIEYLQKQIVEHITKQSVANKAITGQLLNNEQKVDLNKKVLNLKEAAAYLSISPSYLYKLTHRKTIKFSKPNGKTIYFDREYLESYMLSGMMRSKEEIASEALTYCTLTNGKGGRNGK